MPSVLIDENQYTLEEEFLCLDLVNTVDWRKSPHPEEDLPSYAALVDWALSKGLVDTDIAGQLRQTAASDPQNAQAALHTIRALREDIHKILVSFPRGEIIPPGSLHSLNRFLAAALAHSRLDNLDGRVVLSWNDAGSSLLDPLLWPVTRSAVNLLISGSLDRIRECADDRGCGWLFYDNTRNRSRRWCSMESCGNRAKAQRHYHRERPQITQTDTP